MSLTNASPVDVARSASKAALTLASLSATQRDEALAAIHDRLAASKELVLAANAHDLAIAADAAKNGELSLTLVKRLDLARPGKYEDMLKGIRDVQSLPNPIGEVTLRTELDDGLVLERITCPIGVLLIIFEARPEVIANIASLAIKSGNAAILKGGKESTETFKAISTIISEVLDQSAVPNDAVQLVTTRDSVEALLQQDRYIDLVIPRGGNALVRHCKDNTRIPVLGHADGLCSIYLCADVDASAAIKVILDAKLGYPAACNSVETLLVDEEAFSKCFPAVAEALLERGVSLRCDTSSKAALSRSIDKHKALLLIDATADDFDTEFLDLVIAIKTVPTSNSAHEAVDFAIEHINTHGSHHTDAILTTRSDLAERFMDGVDSAGVYWNTSTRMADGMRYGFGTEVGISTNKIHSRGPVGLEGLTIYKYKIRGQYQTPAEYGEGKRAYKHSRIL